MFDSIPNRLQKNSNSILPISDTLKACPPKGGVWQRGEGSVLHKKVNPEKNLGKISYPSAQDQRAFSTQIGNYHFTTINIQRYGQDLSYPQF